MRLSDQQVRVIVESVREILKLPGDLFLYGSRVNPTLKGGDIDLVFLVDETDMEKPNKKLAQVLAMIKKKIGEQRIDFSIVHRSEAETNPFWRRALEAAILLQSIG